MVFRQSFQEIDVDTFGGLATVVGRMDLKPGMAGDCQNVEFVPGGVKSRFGLTTALNPSNVGKYTGLYSFVKADSTRRLLALQDNGTLWKESPQGTLVSVDAALGTNQYMKAATQYGRAYIALSDGKHGTDLVRQFDDTNLDPVAPEGPVGPCNPVENATAGNIAVGTRYTWCVYVTRTGYVTRPTASQYFSGSLTGAWIASGNKTVDVSRIPTAPPHVLSVWIFVSPANDYTQGHTLPQLQVSAGVTTLTAVNFTEAALANGKALAPYFLNVALPPMSGVLFFRNRMLAWGGLNVQDISPVDYSLNLRNLTFNAETIWNLPTIPGGWGAVISTGAGVTDSLPGAVGRCYTLTGDGATATIARISQTWGSLGGNNFSGAPLNNNGYTFYFKAARNSSLNAGNLVVSFGIYGSTTIAASTLTTNFQVFSFTTSPSPAPNGTIIEIYATGTPNNGGKIYVDWVLPVPTSQPYTGSQVWVSNQNDPETISGLSGFLLAGVNDGQDVRNIILYGDTAIIIKERTTYYAYDPGADPINWVVNPISDIVGCGGVQAADAVEDMVAVAARPGLYLYQGGQPFKVSDEFQPTWDRINWAQAHKMVVTIDSEKRRIYVEAPLDSATDISTTLVVDYYEGLTSGLLTGGEGRKWTTWTAYGSSMILAERNNGRRVLFIGSNDSSGKVYQYDSTATEDSGRAINAFYETAPIGMNPEVTLFGVMVISVSGAGILNLSYTKPDNTNVGIAGLTLANPAPNYLERQLNLKAERLGFRFGTNAVGASWSVNSLSVFAKPAPYFTIRGYNP